VKPLKLTPIIPTEAAEQSAVIDWWSRYAPAHGLDERLLFSVPNAQKFMSKARNIHAAYAQIKKEGHRDGIPDLFLAVPMSMPPPLSAVLFSGMFCEMKRIGGKASAEQLEMATVLRSRGYNVVIAEGAQEAIRAITAYLGDPSTSRRSGQ
jgi:hypothetical protein